VISIYKYFMCEHNFFYVFLRKRFRRFFCCYIKQQMATILPPKNAEKFYCEKCDFRCRKQSDYDRHLLTRKHKLATKSTEKMPKNAVYFCDCGKKYKDRTGLWRHKKKCAFNKDEEEEVERKKPESENASLAKELVPLIKDLIVDIIPVLQPNHTDNSMNNNFNINMFLNEQCKDAMNISDFIESIQLSLDDMKSFSNQGQTRGMTNILIDKLNNLDIFHRPVHCSDARKEIIYVKDEDKWEKENKERPKLKHALDGLTKKSIQALPEFKSDPDEYVKTVSEVLKEPREDKKIISDVAKEMLVK